MISATIGLPAGPTLKRIGNTAIFGVQLGGTDCQEVTSYLKAGVHGFSLPQVFSLWHDLRPFSPTELIDAGQVPFLMLFSSSRAKR